MHLHISCHWPTSTGLSLLRKKEQGSTTPNLSIVQSCSVQISKSYRNCSLNGTNPLMESFHTLVRSPDSVFIFLPAIYRVLTLSGAFQHGESENLALTSATVLFLRYLARTISCHNPFWVSNFHHHLTIKLIFCFLRSLTPRPPLSMDLQILVPWPR